MYFNLIFNSSLSMGTNKLIKQNGKHIKKLDITVFYAYRLSHKQL